jgi:hypothetical protein
MLAIIYNINHQIQSQFFMLTYLADHNFVLDNLILDNPIIILNAPTKAHTTVLSPSPPKSRIRIRNVTKPSAS